MTIILIFRFKFVKSSGCNIVPVQVPRGQEKNATVMKHISGQGPLYISAMEILSFGKVINSHVSKKRFSGIGIIPVFPCIFNHSLNSR